MFVNRNIVSLCILLLSLLAILPIDLFINADPNARRIGNGAFRVRDSDFRRDRRRRRNRLSRYQRRQRHRNDKD
ncbi:hypothetical protein Anas_11025 [Armadillidium nasatum]|uniref:Uncharacterized protein n=1 Tax=Armadillidium nasatum TaxID=96803 RepID=A0A5N5SMT9_9CRUS|nr:hypothetical protein Anas_11025 [Armadillidium nasatum]